MDLIPVATAQQKTTRKLVHGFTLIEMLVAVALFTVVMLIAIGTLTSMINADRKAQSLQSIVDSLQFVLDDMSRSILTGVTFHCTTGSENPDPTLTDTKDCFSGSGSSYIAVEGARGNPSDAYDQIVYWFSAESCKNGPGGSILPLYIGGCIEKSNDTGTTWSPLTPPEVGVDYLSFFVQGSGLGDSIQPRAFAVISAHVALPDGKSTKLNVQTSFTQRIFDQ